MNTSLTSSTMASGATTPAIPAADASEEARVRHAANAVDLAEHIVLFPGSPWAEPTRPAAVCQKRVQPMSVSRQQRRERLKESFDRVARYGINLDDSPPQQMWSLIGLTRVLIDILDGSGPARASDAAKRAHEFFELSLKRNPSNHRIECAKGCGFCCHLRVSAMAPEVFHVANFVRKQ